MLLINIVVNENLLSAANALKKATSDNIIDRCEKYLQLLNEYREELYKFRGSAEINLYQSPLSHELVDQTRRAIRSAVETSTRQRNETESLLKSFTFISGYEAVKTFNQLEYQGFVDWELRANEVRQKTDANRERFTIQEAVQVASLLRREAYVKYKTTVWQ